MGVERLKHTVSHLNMTSPRFTVITTPQVLSIESVSVNFKTEERDAELRSILGVLGEGLLLGILIAMRRLGTLRSSISSRFSPSSAYISPPSFVPIKYVIAIHSNSAVLAEMTWISSCSRSCLYG